MVPDYYIEKSRDFQILCRMYDFAMNGLKYNIDSMQSLTDTRKIKDTVLPLLGDKLGIYDKEAYANRQMLEALPIAIKYKGSLKSVKVLLNAFLDSMDIFETAIVMYAKTSEEAEEISGILDRKVNPYSFTPARRSCTRCGRVHGTLCTLPVILHMQSIRSSRHRPIFHVVEQRHRHVRIFAVNLKHERRHDLFVVVVRDAVQRVTDDFADVVPVRFHSGTDTTGDHVFAVADRHTFRDRHHRRYHDTQRLVAE